MIKTLKSNKFIVMFLIIICIFFIINPKVCAKSCLNGISVWGTKVLPMLLPFFVLTRLILNLCEFKPNIMDKFFNKAYNAPNGSFLVFFLSVLAGYPMGAKLICYMYENKQITNIEAQKMLSFCSVSGPMFIIGTVGVAIFNSFRVGLVILISNIIACLLNGLIYRGKFKVEEKTINYKNKTSIFDIVYDSLISILMVGVYIALSFVVINLIKECKLLFVIDLLEKVFYLDLNMVKAVITGIIEITCGCIEISETSVNLALKTVLTSGIIAFGGLSVFMQSLGFLKCLNIKPKIILLQKLTQCLICLVVSIPFAIILL